MQPIMETASDVFYSEQQPSDRNDGRPTNQWRLRISGYGSHGIVNKMRLHGKRRREIWILNLLVAWRGTPLKISRGGQPVTVLNRTYGSLGENVEDEERRWPQPSHVGEQLTSTFSFPSSTNV